LFILFALVPFLFVCTSGCSDPSKSDPKISGKGVDPKLLEQGPKKSGFKAE